MLMVKRVAGCLRSDHNRCSTGPDVLEVHPLGWPSLWEENEENNHSLGSPRGAGGPGTGAELHADLVRCADPPSC
jgi:hypothetical protein